MNLSYLKIMNSLNALKRGKLPYKILPDHIIELLQNKMQGGNVNLSLAVIEARVLQIDSKNKKISFVVNIPIIKGIKIMPN